MSHDQDMSFDEFHAYLYQTTRMATDAERTVSDMVTFVGQVASDRQDKGTGRSKISDYIGAAMPLAQREGRTQVLILGAAHHVVRNGGLQGKPLAPVSLYEYFRLTLRRVQRLLLPHEPQAMESDAFWQIYQQAILDPSVPASQRNKVAAMLEVFHRFLVIAGCEPLRRSLATGRQLAPPAAAVVWPHELEKAVSAVDGLPIDPTIKAQCEIGLRLAALIPIRAYELWCIRVGDISGLERVVLDIYPRRRDGVRKTRATRHQVEIRDRAVAALLLDWQARRFQDEGAMEEDVLLGDPSMPDGRYEETLTTRLMNWALKVATGNPQAGFHDLRHTAISRAAKPVLKGGRFDG